MEPGWACFPSCQRPPPDRNRRALFLLRLWTSARHPSACLRSPDVRTFIRYGVSRRDAVTRPS